ncbi:hypothetical protein [Plantactinospora sp. WMMB782]|uniref:hypothetical protein n=1 Tax=Plantactinospora sp. WMMB782 TaxID=3404121 RepID=UPI003B92DBB2
MKRGAPLKTFTPLVRKTPLRRVSEKKAADGGNRFSTLDEKPTESLSKPMKRARYVPAVPVNVKVALAVRSGGRCEIAIPGCTGTATDPAHRLKRGMGGRKGAAKAAADRLSGLMHACRRCHSHTHANPAEAYSAGWMLREGQEPTQVSVLYRGRMVWLDDAGQVHDYSAGAA